MIIIIIINDNKNKNTTKEKINNNNNNNNNLMDSLFIDLRQAQDLWWSWGPPAFHRVSAGPRGVWQVSGPCHAWQATGRAVHLLENISKVDRTQKRNPWQSRVM